MKTKIYSIGEVGYKIRGMKYRQRAIFGDEMAKARDSESMQAEAFQTNLETLYPNFLSVDGEKLFSSAEECEAFFDQHEYTVLDEALKILFELSGLGLDSIEEAEKN